MHSILFFARRTFEGSTTCSESSVQSYLQYAANVCLLAGKDPRAFYVTCSAGTCHTHAWWLCEHCQCTSILYFIELATGEDSMIMVRDVDFVPNCAGVLVPSLYPSVCKAGVYGDDDALYTDDTTDDASAFDDQTSQQSTEVSGRATCLAKLAPSKAFAFKVTKQVKFLCPHPYSLVVYVPYAVTNSIPTCVYTLDHQRLLQDCVRLGYGAVRQHAEADHCVDHGRCATQRHHRPDCLGHGRRAHVRACHPPRAAGLLGHAHLHGLRRVALLGFPARRPAADRAGEWGIRLRAAPVRHSQWRHGSTQCYCQQHGNVNRLCHFGAAFFVIGSVRNGSFL